ncbi:hypothetical protein [Burkholderia ubonensis]|uniref:hypothetical protein n=1 Tax=Burkholderia ubonensis TaxID=101571 RepID=UPI001056150F|nr:hypothetical protein [Burkholderia ubonensis]
MVGIAQPENFGFFLRKVGYSVGLENTFGRFSDFCEEYSRTPQLKIGDWSNLIHHRWNLKTSNISDVFASLGIAQVTSQGIFAGPFGEAGAICVRLLDTKSEREEALRHILALSILLADGDIFLNCLAAEFQPDDISRRLMSMVLVKRQSLFELFKSQGEREAIAAAVTIERQRTNKGGASKVSRLTAATSAGLTGGLGHLGLPKPKDVYAMDPPSGDYIRHVIPSRREWARSLGLCGKDGAVTSQGWHWLQCIGKAGFTFDSGEYSLRPTKFELERSRLASIRELMAHAPSTWDYVSLVSSGLTVTDTWEKNSLDNDEIAAITLCFFDVFRDFAQDRRILRNELPLLVALSAYMGISRARGESLIDYEAWLKCDLPQKFGIKVRSSRTIELGIIAPSNGQN